MRIARKQAQLLGAGDLSRARTADVRHETVRQAYQDATAVAGDWFALDPRSSNYASYATSASALPRCRQPSTCLPNAREKCTGIRVANRAMSSCSAVTWWIARRGKLRFPEAKTDAARRRLARSWSSSAWGPTTSRFRRSLRRRPAVRGSLPGSGLAPELRLPLLENEFLDASVNFAAPHWRDLYDRVKAHANTTLLMLPQELRPTCQG